MDRDKLRKKLAQQSARDDTSMRNWKTRKEQRYTKLMEEPVLPNFCKLCFLFMVIATFLAVFHDVFVYYSYGRVYPLAKMLDNATKSAFFTWLVFAAMVIPGSIVQLRRGFDDRYFERYRAPKKGRPQMPLEKRFRLYAVISGAGLLLFGVLALVF